MDNKPDYITRLETAISTLTVEQLNALIRFAEAIRDDDQAEIERLQAETRRDIR